MRASVHASLRVTSLVTVLLLAVSIAPIPADAQSVVIGQNANAVGPFADGFYSGIPHYQDNEPHCDRNPLLPSNIVCMVNGYNGTEDLIGDAWPKILETQDNTRTWQSRFASGHAADPATNLGLGFGADPIMVCFPGGCAGFFIAANRSEDGGVGGGVFMELMPELNIEAGFRHYSLASGPRTVQLGTGSNFLDKIDVTFLPNTANPGTISVTETVSIGNGETRSITRDWIKGRFIVVYASINSSNQNIRVYSTFSDDYGQSWSPPKQVAQTTGLDTGVSVTAIDDTVLYAYRQFQDDSGDQTNAVFAALSTDGGKQIGKVFPIFESICPFDQTTLPNEENQGVITPRTNNFVDLSNDGSNFIAVLASRIKGPDGSCATPPFDYTAGSRVLVTAATVNNPKKWSAPVELAPVDPAGPAEGHAFQFMPAVDCILGDCQSIWYDSFRDSARNIAYLKSGDRGGDAATRQADADAFKAFPLYGDFLYELQSNGSIVQFRRTADIYARQFRVGGGGSPQIVFNDPEPVRVTRFQLYAPAPQTNPELLFETEQLSTTLKQYGGNKAAFVGDYVNLASDKLRVRTDAAGPNGEPYYESNAGPDPANPNLRAKWWAIWTDTRNATGQLYTDSLTDALPFAKSPTSMATADLDEGSGDDVEDILTAEQKLGAQGVQDTGTVDEVCQAPTSLPAPGTTLRIENNKNRIKDADVYGALIEQPATAWVLNGTKGFGPGRPQRAFVIAARNENENASRTFRFEIANQPQGFDDDEARASWEQLPFENFINTVDVPVEIIDETVGPQSSVTVALFVVSQLPVNPVTVNVYDVVAGGALELVETLVVNGEVEAGPLITPAGAPDDVNVNEIHNPFVYDPYDPDTVNPTIWNPTIWNPTIWNPTIWNPTMWNPTIWNPTIWNPTIWNPTIWNPTIWNPTPVSGSASTLSSTSSVWDQPVVDANNIDNPEIPEPDLSNLVNPDAPLVGKVDVQFGAANLGNTLTPYVADFAINSNVIRQLLADNKLATQLIVWEDARTTSFTGCTPDEINGQNRIIAVANNPDFLNLKIPDIVNNRFGSITYYLEPGDQVYLTLRFLGSEEAIRTTADDLFDPDNGGISYVITSQAANTGSQTLRNVCTGAATEVCEQAIRDSVPPTLIVNASDFPVPLPATVEGGEVGAVLPTDLVTAQKGEFENPDVFCGKTADLEGDPASAVALGEFLALDIGVSELTCLATAENDATGTAAFDVDVFDNEPPTLGTLPADFTVEREALDGTSLATTTQAAAMVWDGAEDLPTATDNIGIDGPVVCEPIAPGGFVPFDPADPTNATLVACSATDLAGNVAEGTFTITVADTTAPVIAPIADIIDVEATVAAGADVTINAPSVTEVGNLDSVDCTATIGGSTVSVIGTTTFPIGSTLVTCNATDDAGNAATAETFTVTVFDTTAPVISMVADIAAEANAAGGANVTFTEPTATDLGAPVDVTCDRMPSGDFYPLYAADGGPATTVTCSASDGANTATETFTVTVSDTTPPELAVPNDITVALESVDGTEVTFDVTATDIADPAPSVTCTPASGSLFDEGTTSVDCEAVDASGNAATDSFNVTVELQLAPGGLRASKNNVNAGSSVPFYWSWIGPGGTPFDIGDGNQDIEARAGSCPSGQPDVIVEDPGSSGFQKMSDNSWQYNWQTVDTSGNPVASGKYCVSVILLTTGQTQSTEIRVR